MKYIAFISIGKDSHNNAEYLVKSIKKNCVNFKIIQISRKIDKKIKYVDYKLEFEFEGDKLMVNKLQVLKTAYRKFGSLFFLDSDMMVIKNLDDIFDTLTKYDLIFTLRKTNFPISAEFKNVKFPEFIGKTINDVMPFNAGFIGINSFEAIDFIEKTCSKLPRRFHFWYGDQYAQKLAYDSNKFKILTLDYNYNNSIKKLESFDSNVFIYHFKGRFKDLMGPFYNKFININ